jgi:cytochrome c553
MNRRTLGTWGAFAALALGLVACAPTANGPRAAEPPIASVWRARCGTCHARVEPGEKTNAVLKAAAKRHEKRVHLSVEEWDALVAWLSPASPSPAAPSPAPATPPASPLSASP